MAVPGSVRDTSNYKKESELPHHGDIGRAKGPQTVPLIVSSIPGASQILAKADRDSRPPRGDSFAQDQQSINQKTDPVPRPVIIKNQQQPQK